MTDYGRRVIVDRPFECTLWLAIEAFVTEGFIVRPTDVTGMVKGVNGDDLRRYVLLDVTHPDLTWQALRLDLDSGVVLPCQIAVYELGDGETVVTVGYPLELLTSLSGWLADNPALAQVAEAIEARVGRALGVIARAAAVKTLSGGPSGWLRPAA